MIKKFDEFINENIFDGIGRRSKGGVVRKEDEIKSVDLGLPSGTIWATCNLGASSPEEYGDYYSWGETEPKDNYTWNTYKFGTKGNLTKYNGEDRKSSLYLEDDAANAVLGGKWHIPTKKQIIELLDDENTTNEYSELNGVKGRLFTSKKNGNTLFFPFSGFKSGSYVNGEGEWSSCWSSFLDIFSDLSSYRYSTTLYCKFNKSEFDFSDRCNGYSVRGVLDKK